MLKDFNKTFGYFIQVKKKNIKLNLKFHLPNI